MTARKKLYTMNDIQPPGPFSALLVLTPPFVLADSFFRTSHLPRNDFRCSARLCCSGADACIHLDIAVWLLLSLAQVRSDIKRCRQWPTYLRRRWTGFPFQKAAERQSRKEQCYYEEAQNGRDSAEPAPRTHVLALVTDEPTQL